MVLPVAYAEPQVSNLPKVAANAAKINAISRRGRTEENLDIHFVINFIWHIPWIRH
jgi:hypothetical protein